jgi:hypothetical protein
VKTIFLNLVAMEVSRTILVPSVAFWRTKSAYAAPGCSEPICNMHQHIDTSFLVVSTGGDEARIFGVPLNASIKSDVARPSTSATSTRFPTDAYATRIAAAFGGRTMLYHTVVTPWFMNKVNVAMLTFGLGNWCRVNVQRYALQ